MNIKSTTGYQIGSGELSGDPHEGHNELFNQVNFDKAPPSSVFYKINSPLYDSINVMFYRDKLSRFI